MGSDIPYVKGYPNLSLNCYDCSFLRVSELITDGETLYAHAYVVADLSCS